MPVVKRQLPSTFPYHPGLVATGAGAVWVVHGPPGCSPPLNGGQSPDCRGTLLTRVDPATGKPSWTVRLGFDPAGMAVGAGAVWLTDGTFAATGTAAQLTLTERITFRSGVWFEADMSGVVSPAGFIVLNGTVTASSDSSFLGAQVHQRSNLDGGDGTTTTWTGELRLMPASA
jgi:hypothetical protein